MALSASTVLEIRTGGVDTNGAGFVTGASGTDWSQQNAAQYAVTDGVTAGTTTITSATANFGTDVVGNIMYVQGGTGSVTAGWYQITARTNSTTITVDRSTGLTAGTGVTLNIGGALLSPGIAASIMTVAGMLAYIKNDGSVFSITSATINVAGGVISTSSFVWFVGYSSTRTVANTDSPPTFQTNVSTATQCAAANATFVNIIFDGNTQTACKHAVSGVFQNCTIKRFNTATTGNPILINCLYTLNSVGQPWVAIATQFTANTATPFRGVAAVDCISNSNTGASTDGFGVNSSNSPTSFTNCTSVGNGRDGFRMASSTPQALQNCIAQGNAGYGLTGASSSLRINFATYDNTLGPTNTAAAPSSYAVNDIAYTADAFVNVAGGNYNLNNVAGGGASLRALSSPLTYPAGLTTNARDIGAAQHQETSTVNIFPVFD